MNIEHLLGKRLAEDPKDAQTPSHRLLLRGGYIRQIGQGIYSLLPLGYRVAAKVCQIIREEMNAIGGQEIQMPVTTPAELWEESGRYNAIGDELVRFKDRTGHPMVLNMTHEEVVVDVVRSQVDSYRQLPLMVYQLQTKFRDEARSRAGLIRVREFTMKDAYSFHRTQEDLEAYYQQCHRAYMRIFRRVGLLDFVDIESDTGMMGGSKAHEFMLLTPVGEDTIALCPGCGYRANREVATTKRPAELEEAEQPLTEVHTPGTKTIEDLAAFLKIAPEQTCKCVAFVAVPHPVKQGEAPRREKKVMAFVRGDLEVNPAKLRRAVAKQLGYPSDLRPMHEEEFASVGAVAGYTGSVGLSGSDLVVLFDESVALSGNFVVGANKVDYHRTGFNFRRDAAGAPVADITDVREGDPCPECSTPMRLSRGIEIGNIFQLGTKYTESMTMTYDEEDRSKRHPIMGCYGIGVGRTVAAVVEESHTDKGPIWPITIAPFEVQVCALAAKDDAVRAAAEKLAADLEAAGVEVLLDTRQVNTGFMFADADLIGAPIRAIVSKRNLAAGKVELKVFTPKPYEGLPGDASLEEAVSTILAVRRTLRDAIEGHANALG